MKTLESKKIKLYSEEDGQYYSIDALHGESAFEIAQRLGFKGSEQEWMDRYVTEIEANGDEWLNKINAAGTDNTNYVQEVVEEAVKNANNATNSATSATKAATLATTNANNAISGLPEKISEGIEQRIGQITDALTSGNEYAAELVSARTDEDGYVHTSLKERIDNGMNTLEDQKAVVIPAHSDRAAYHELHAQNGPMSVMLHGKTIETGTGDKSPDNPYVISGVNVARVHCGGKNLFDINKVPFPVTGNSFYMKTNGYGCCIYTDTNGTASNILDKDGMPQPGIKNMPYLAAGTYRLSATVTFDATDGRSKTLRVGTVEDDGTYKFIADITNPESGGTFTLAQPARITIRKYSSGGCTISNLMLSAGADAVPFAAYDAAAVELPLLPDGAPLMGNGTVDDTIENDVLSGCDKYVILDGSADEYWNKSASWEYSFYGTHIPEKPVDSVYYSNLLPCIPVLNNWTSSKVVDGICFSEATGYLNIKAKSLGANTVAEWRAALATNPLIVFYRSTEYTPDKDIKVTKVTRKWATVEITGGFSAINGEGKWARQSNDICAKMVRTAQDGSTLQCNQLNAYYGQISNTPVNTVQVIPTEASQLHVNLNNNNNLDEINAHFAANPLVIVGKLTTPEVYMTDPCELRKPVNLIPVTVTGSSETEVEYPHNTKYYIDKVADRTSILEDAVSKALPTDKTLSFEDRAANAKTVGNEINVLKKHKADAIVHEVSGNIITLDNASDLGLHSLRIFGKTTQEGTPTPNAPVSLVTAGADGNVSVTLAGKNLFQDTRSSKADYTHNGVTFVTNADGTYTANGTNNTSEDRSIIRITSTGKWLYLPAGTYTVSSGLPNDYVYFQVSHNDEMVSEGSTAIYAYATPKTFSIDKPKYIWLAIIARPGRTFENLVFKPQIEIGNAATEYEQPREYQMMTAATPNGLPGIPVSSGGNYIDENGQRWVCDEIDFTRGVLVQRIGRLTLDGDTVKVTGCIKASSGLWRVDRRLADADMSSGTMRGTLMSTHYKGELTAQKENVCYVSSDGYLMLHADNNISADMIPEDENKTTIVANYNTWLTANPVTVLYPLAVPVETALDADTLAAYTAMHTVKPDTTIYNNAGAWQTMEYAVDTKKYIDKAAPTSDIIKAQLRSCADGTSRLPTSLFINGTVTLTETSANYGKVSKNIKYMIVTEEIQRFPFPVVLAVTDHPYELAVSRYDENGAFIRSDGYVRAEQYIAAGESFRVTMSRSDITSGIADIAEYVEALQVLPVQSAPNTVVTDGAINAMLGIAEEYFNWAYNTEGSSPLIYNGSRSGMSLFDKPLAPTTADDGVQQYSTNCSIFANTLLRGIRLSDSRYMLGSDAINKQQSWAYNYDNTALTWGVGAVNTYNMYRYAENHGFGFRIADDYSNVRPGDFLFVSDFDQYPTQYRGICHVVMCLQIDPKNDRIRVIESTSSATRKVPGSSEAVPVGCWVTTETLSKQGYKYAARFPIGDAGGAAEMAGNAYQTSTDNYFYFNPLARGIYTFVIKGEFTAPPALAVKRVGDAQFTVYNTLAAGNGAYAITMYISNPTTSAYVRPATNSGDMIQNAVCYKGYASSNNAITPNCTPISQITLTDDNGLAQINGLHDRAFNNSVYHVLVKGLELTDTTILPQNKVFFLDGFRYYSNYGLQRITTYSDPATIYQRAIANGTWSEWKAFSQYAG